MARPQYGHLKVLAIAAAIGLVFATGVVAGIRHESAKGSPRCSVSGIFRSNPEARDEFYSLFRVGYGHSIRLVRADFPLTKAKKAAVLRVAGSVEQASSSCQTTVAGQMATTWARTATRMAALQWGPKPSSDWATLVIRHGEAANALLYLYEQESKAAKEGRS